MVRRKRDVLEPLDRRTYDIMTETLNQRFSVAEIAQRAAEGAALDADQAAKVAIEIARALRASS